MHAVQILDKLKNKILPEAKEMIDRTASGTGSTYPSSIAKVQSLDPIFCCILQDVSAAKLTAFVSHLQELETVETEVEAQVECSSLTACRSTLKANNCFHSGHASVCMQSLMVIRNKEPSQQKATATAQSTVFTDRGSQRGQGRPVQPEVLPERCGAADQCPEGNCWL